MTAAPAEQGRVIYNLDCTEFFVSTFGPPVPATIDEFTDAHAALGITDLFINVNAKRTNYRSSVWEAYWDGYDPTAADEQPFFAGLDPQRRFETGLFKNMLALHQTGCDYPQRMIDGARRNQQKAWISVRMNDDHAPERPEHPSHSTLWKSHPEWRLAYGLDYEKPEVREHYINLIEEVCGRYDLDGLELDFLRFWLYFRKGREHQGVSLMTALVERARQATVAAATRLGHPVQLAVRVPSTPWIARRHGLDAIAWARAGYVDLIVVSSFWFSVDSDMPIETWKGLLAGSDVAVAIHLEDGIKSGAHGRRTMTHEEMRGVIASGLHRGADDVYLFNLFTGPYQRWPRADHDQLVRDAGSAAALAAGPRRHAVTMTHPWAAGEPGAERELPYSGTHGIFRLHIGPLPTAQQYARIELVVTDSERPLNVTLNDMGCPWSGLVDAAHVAASGWTEEQPQRHAYDVPTDALSEGYNAIEVRAGEEMEITWVEISVQQR